MASAPKFDPPVAPRFAPRGTLADHFMTIAPDQRHASQDIAATAQRLRAKLSMDAPIADEPSVTKGFAPRAITWALVISLPLYIIAGLMVAYWADRL